MFRPACLLCGSTDLHQIFDLGMHPFADTFVPADALSRADRLYPLIGDLCSPCAQIQLRTVTEPAERYQEIAYSYTSSNSAFSREHWTDYARHVSQIVGLRANDLVVEIGSNDGFLAARFREAGQRVVGVDPSTAMADLARERGVETVIDFFSERVASTLLDQHGHARLVVANNVINHANDPIDFLRGAHGLLADDGTFVFELPYWLPLVKEARFDQIYHEHVTYWTTTYASAAARTAGLVLVRTEEVDHHGGSLRGYCRKRGAPDGSVNETMAAEATVNLFDPRTYAVLGERIRHERDMRLEKIYSLKNAGHALVGIGAPAKGNTFLTYYGLNSTVVDVVTDASPQKIGKYTPGTRIPIVPDASLARFEGAVDALVLSWNIGDTLRAKLREINPRLRFLFIGEEEE